MKITFLIRSLDAGGAERQLVDLAVGLHARGHEVAVVPFYEGGSLAGELQANGVRVTALGKRGRWDVVRPFARLVRQLRKERPDILHPYMTTANIVASIVAPLLARTKIVWGVRATNLDLSRYDRVSRLLDGIERRLSRQPSLVIANSNAGRDHAVRGGFPADKCVVVPNGIDAARFQYDPEGRHRLRSEWNVSADDFVIGLVGRVDPSKGHDVFLTTAARLTSCPRNLRFICVGRRVGDYAQSMEALGRRLGLADRLIWTGERKDMVSVYSALDILCSASPSEGFSNVVGEAMACGTLCVVTDVGDAARIVGPLGVVALGTQSEHLYAALQTALLDLPRDEEKARKRRQRIIDLFSPERLVALTEKLLENATSGDAR